MTYAPATLQTLAKYWVAHKGVNLGIVGDTGHVGRGVSYHLGRGQLTPGAYSAQTQRDQTGLTEAASAIDLGRLDGSLGKLRSFSHWLVQQAQANKPGTRDMREIIYSPAGKTVLRWDRERGYASAARPGEADNSHFTHTHVSWYRDAQNRDHTVAFKPYFAKPQTWTATIRTGPSIQFWDYRVVGGVIQSRDDKHTEGFTASCTAPVTVQWPALATSRRLVQLTSGFLDKHWIEAKYATKGD